MLDWFDNPEQRRRNGSILSKGEGHRVPARASSSTVSANSASTTSRKQRHRASGLRLLTAAVTLWVGAYPIFAISRPAAPCSAARFRL
ncbi:Tn3 family transposase [Sphingomonas sp. CL5.1]|uniref:Tn3 family transposase n=1 Tax=Sphingomonas sp. CL5.1 TaxID=2653203 RepID=UPI0034A0CDF1